MTLTRTHPHASTHTHIQTFLVQTKLFNLLSASDLCVSACNGNAVCMSVYLCVREDKRRTRGFNYRDEMIEEEKTADRTKITC